MTRLWHRTQHRNCYSLSVSRPGMDLAVDVLSRDEGAGRLAWVLEKARNSMGAEGAGRLGRLLRECKALAHLDLMGNQIVDAGASWLAGVLGEGKALSRLALRGKKI
eukprot:2999534-Rhodomonas_salina.1